MITPNGDTILRQVRFLCKFLLTKRSVLVMFVVLKNEGAKGEGMRVRDVDSLVLPHTYFQQSYICFCVHILWRCSLGVLRLARFAGSSVWDMLLIEGSFL